MAQFKNFKIWRGRLPHWRADDVTYYVTFKHSRALTEPERHLLLAALCRPEGRRWDLIILCVLPEKTELMFRVHQGPTGETYELSDIVEKAKTRVGRKIIKATGERFPPFYGESYDRIVRDDAELEERWMAILGSPVEHELTEEPEEYAWLYVPGHQA
jgi:hypothetical protein